MRWIVLSVMGAALGLGSGVAGAASADAAAAAQSTSTSAPTSAAKKSATHKKATHHSKKEESSKEEAKKSPESKHSKHGKAALHSKHSKTEMRKKTPTPSMTEAELEDAKAPDATMGAEEMKIAAWVDQGTFACDAGDAVTLTADDKVPGYFVLAHQGHHYRVSPRVSVSGAVRLESNAGGFVWLQLANKSMLLAPKLSERLADGCMSDSQKKVAAAMLSNPSDALFGNGQAKPSAPAVAAAAAPAVKASAAAGNAMPVLRLVEVPATVVHELPSQRAQAAAASSPAPSASSASTSDAAQK